MSADLNTYYIGGQKVAARSLYAAKLSARQCAKQGGIQRERKLLQASLIALRGQTGLAQRSHYVTDYQTGKQYGTVGALINNLELHLNGKL